MSTWQFPSCLSLCVFQVYVLLDINCEVKEIPTYLTAHYDNLKFGKIDFSTFMEYSVMEPLWADGLLTQGEFYLHNISDILRCQI